nr:reverse transcriptase domain-containing protein [Tanacetum cinerariifolium]
MALITRIAIYSGQIRFDLTFVSTSWRHPWDPTLEITLRRMSAMANTTPIVTTVTKPVTNPRDTNATPRVNIQYFCEEYYEDILPIIIDKVRRDKRKEVHARLDFGEGSRERRTREDSHNSSARTLSVRLERLKVRDRLRYNDGHVFDRLSHRRQSAFDRLSETYSPSTTKSRPDRTSSRDHSRGRSRPHKLDASSGDRPENKECFPGIGESDLEDYVKIFQAAAQVKRWAMPTWCHMFNSILIGAARVWFDELPPESIDSYKDLKAVFLAYFMQQKKYVKDPVAIHNIKQKDGETIEDFMQRFKVETGRMKGAPECMRIFGFMHGVNNPELTKRLNEHVPKTMEEMMITTTAFIRGEAAAASKNQGKEEGLAGLPPYKDTKRNSRGRGRKVPAAATYDDPSKLSHLIKKIKHGRDQSKSGKKETPAKDKLAAIYMIQSWQRMARQKVTQSFERVREITYPPLSTSSEAEGPLVIEAETGGHMFHRMYVDEGSSMEVLYEHCFNRLRPEVKNQMVPATTSLTGFSEKTIWPLGQLRLLVTIGDADHSTRAWMNFMIFPADGGILTIHSTILIPAECATVITSSESSDMTGVPRSVAEHRLNTQEGYSPVRQKKGSGLGTRQGHPSRGAKISRGRDHERSLLSRLVVQSSHGKKTRRQLANVRRFHGFKQGMFAESDKEKTAFHTGQRVYCYTKMPFGLKNVGAMYQRLVDKAFDSQIGRNIKVFLSKLAKKSFLLFKTLKKYIKKSDFYWTPEAEQAFKQLKQHLSELPLLVAPKPKEELIVYMSTSYEAISAVLMTERGMVQTPFYFVSCALHGLELNYTPMEKLVLSLVFTAKRLRRMDNLEPPKMSAISCAESHGNPKGYPTYKKKAINISSGTKVGGNMSRMQAWTEVVDKVKYRLSNWKMKSLSIGEKGGLGVSSLYALNRALMMKWVWRFYSQKESLWARVIKAIYGDDGHVGKVSKAGSRSCWRNIVNEVRILSNKGIKVLDYMRIKLGNGESTAFWDDNWIGGKALKWVWSLEGSREFSVASIRKIIDDNRLSIVHTRTL